MNKREVIEDLTRMYKDKEKELVQGYSISSRFVDSETKYKTFTDELYKLRQEYEDSLRKVEYSE